MEGLERLTDLEIAQLKTTRPDLFVEEKSNANSSTDND